ncbi:MAG: HlyD family efflux transporter periplasmic adaptor subunit [Christensenellales bacterium]|jgi:putative membrane fusion protein
MRKIRIKLRFFVILAVVLIAGLVLILIPKQPATMRLTQGALAYESTKDAVFVRDEQVYKSATWGKVTYLAAEGERVQKGAQVAVVYKGGYNDKVLQDLFVVQQEISDYITTNVLQGVLNTELEASNVEIDKATQRIKKAVAGTSNEDLLVLEQLLLDQMDRRQTQIRETVENPDEEYAALIQEEQALLERLQSWKTEVMAQDAGMVSFYFDGCEDFLSPDAIDTLTRSDLDNILQGKSPGKAVDASTGEPLYRLVNNYKWYCLIRVEEDNSTELAADLKYNISFEGFYDRPYEGKVVSSKPLDTGTLFVVEMSEDIGPMLSVRQATANLKKSYEGIVAPLDAIKSNADGVAGIYVVGGDKAEFVPVEIEYDDGENAVIHSAQEGLELQSNMLIQL